MFENRRPQRESLVAAAVLFAAITTARFLVRNPAEVIGVLYVIPVALLAVEYRVRGGLAASFLAIALNAGWAILEGAPVTVIGYGARVTAFVAVGIMVGLLTAERERHRRHAARWFAMSNDLLCTASLEGYFTDVNASWQKLLGYSREELLDRPYGELVHPDDVEATNRVSAKLTSPSAIAEFENRYRAKDGSWHWLLWSARSDGERIYAVAKDVTNRKHADDERESLLSQVTRLARTDDLTGLANRSAWRTRLGEELVRARRSGDPLTAVLIDLDRFKALNDAEGHQAGDRMLKECSSSWQGVLRATDLLGRLGGDEFGVVLPDCDAGDALEVVDRLRESTPAPMTCSVGFATWDGAETIDPLLARADEALYAAKGSGRDRVHSAT